MTDFIPEEMRFAPTPDQDAKFANLIRVLREVPDEKFAIEVWHHNNACGTVACAIGWAAQDPWFMAKGLFLEPSRSSDTDSIPCVVNLFVGGEPAVTTFFGIDRKLFLYLFSFRGYYDLEIAVRPTDVIQHIKNVVASSRILDG